MKTFELIRPESLAAARTAAGPTKPMRGAGIDLIDHLKEGLIEPEALVELRRVGGTDGAALGSATAVEGQLELGALLTLSALAEHGALRGPFAALAEAAGQAATPSIRNLATLGGNLLQRPRCWYYRDAELVCLKKGGDVCLAIAGDHRYHAILGAAPSFAVHASSLATALVALDAKVRIHGEATRELGIEDLFVLPSEDPTREHRLAADEILTQVLLPAPPADQRSAYHAAREKQSHDWPLAEAAVSLRLEGTKITAARVALGHVAPVPWRSTQAEAALVGKVANTKTFAAAADAALSSAKPLAGNAYKVPVAKGVLMHALHAAAQVPLPA